MGPRYSGCRVYRAGLPCLRGGRMIRATLIAALLASPAVACDNVILHGLSWHSDRDLIEGVNEFNPGIGCRFDTDLSFIETVEAGVFQNSYGDWSAYTGAASSADGFGIFVSIATNYHKDLGVGDNGIMAIAGLQYVAGPVILRAAGPTHSAVDGEKGVVFSASFDLGGW